MVRTASRARKGSPRRPLWQSALALIAFNRLGRLILLGTVLVMLWFLTRDYLLNDVYPSARDEVLRAVGFGFYPVTLWTAVALVTLRFKPRWFLRWRRWWLATALMSGAAVAGLGGFPGASGIVREATLGGLAGQTLWGGPLQGVAVVGGLSLLAGTILRPRYSYVAAKTLLRTFGTTLLASFRGLLRWLWWSLQSVSLGTWTVARALTTKVLRRGESAETAIEEEEDEEEDEEPETLDFAQEEPAIQEEEVSSTVRDWSLPPLELLELGPPAPVSTEETNEVARKIEETLEHHGVQVSVDQIKPGPTVTLYGLTPGWVRRYREVKERDETGNILRDSRGKPVINPVEQQTRVKVDSILAREKDMALALAAPSLRIQAPVPGESVVGIEVPNSDPVLVTGRIVMEAPSFLKIVNDGGLALALGQGSGGDSIAVDLRKLPHLLIAGATGSGKSVCINALIVSLVGRASPELVRLLLIDPKRVELTPFNGLPHLVAPVVVDTEPAVRALKGVLREMFNRYRRMEELGVRNIEGYLRHPQATEPMPYMVIAIDELADLMMAAPYEIEQTICRLAQLGRATGIHLVVATQRPSVDVVTGLIKANFPSRISFAVVSQVDSRTILDSAGADRLLGKGDMLFLSNDTPKPQRIQGAFVSDREIGRIGEFWRSQEWPPLLEFDLEPAPEESKDATWNGTERSGRQDEMLEKAIELASRYSHLSTSLLQRRLRIGYPRAARLMDQLEDEGLIGPGEPGKSREVMGPPRSQQSQP